MTKANKLLGLLEDNPLYSEKWSLKPVKYDDVTASISKDNPGLKSLSVFKETEIMKGPNLASSYFKKEMPPLFIMRAKNGKSYVVRTEGFQYPRYMAEIE